MSAQVLDRRRLVARIDANPKLDALIVGVGIAGAAASRDLALQGLRCLIVDRGDFASAASGAPARAAQAGFRHLGKSGLGLLARAVTELRVLTPRLLSSLARRHAQHVDWGLPTS